MRIKLRIVNSLADRSARRCLMLELPQKKANFLEALPAFLTHNLGAWRFLINRRPAPSPEKLTLHDGDEILALPAVGLVPVLFVVGLTAWSFILRKPLQSLYATPQAKPALGGGGNSASPTYGWDGIHTMADAGIPVPIIYGEMRVGGNYINAFIANTGDNNYYYILLALGEGEVESIAGLTVDTDDAASTGMTNKITVEGQPIGNLEGVTISTRMGADVQDAITDFGELHEVVDYNTKLLGTDNGTPPPVPQVFTGPLSDTDNIYINFHFPSGVYKTDEVDGIKKTSVDVLVEYREWTEAGGSSWTTAGLFKTGDMKKTQSFMRRYAITNLAKKRYEVQVTKQTIDTDKEHFTDTYVASIDYARAFELTYPETALLGLKLLATNQLEGSVSTITTLVKGRKILVYPDGGGAAVVQWSDNPAWVLYDLLLNTRFGLGDYVSAEDIDLDSFKEAAAYCNELVTIQGSTTQEKRFRFNGVFDATTNAMDMLAQVCATCRGFLVWTAGAIRLVIDKPEAAVGLYTMGNIEQDSFQENFSSLKGSRNSMEIQFADTALDFEQNIVQIVDEAALLSGEPMRTEKFALSPGVTGIEQAARIGQYLVNKHKLCLRTIQFSAATDALPFQVGDVWEIAHQMTAWGLASGRIISATTNTVKLDEDVTLAATVEGYNTLRVRHQDGDIEDAHITDVGTFARGTPINIDGTWAQIPAPYAVFSIGAPTTVTKPFRVTNLTRNEDGTAAVTAMEYVADVFLDTPKKNVSGGSYSLLPNPFSPPNPPTNLTATTQISTDPLVRIDWQWPDADATHAPTAFFRVYDSIDNGETWRGTRTATETSATFDYPDAEAAQRHMFKVVSVSQLGVPCPDSLAPTVVAPRIMVIDPSTLPEVAYVGRVLDKDLSLAPSSGVTPGDAYIVGPDVPTGDDWEGHENDIATYTGTTGAPWDFAAPTLNDYVLVVDEGILYYWNGTEWGVYAISSAGTLAVTLPFGFSGVAEKTDAGNESRTQEMLYVPGPVGRIYRAIGLQVRGDKQLANGATALRVSTAPWNGGAAYAEASMGAAEGGKRAAGTLPDLVTGEALYVWCESAGGHADVGGLVELTSI